MASAEGNRKIQQKLINRFGSYEKYLEHMQAIGARGGKATTPRGKGKRYRRQASKTAVEV